MSGYAADLTYQSSARMTATSPKEPTCLINCCLNPLAYPPRWLTQGGVVLGAATVRPTWRSWSRRAFWASLLAGTDQPICGVTQGAGECGGWAV